MGIDDIDDMREECISIIIPAYNVDKFLAKCIDSILAQTYSKLQIIIVDDGSTDETGNIADEYAKNDLRVMVIHQCNAGLVRARKVGVNAARGKYVMYVDADDYVDARWIERMVELQKANDADIVSAGYYLNSEVNKEKRDMDDMSVANDVLKNEQIVISSYAAGVYRAEDLWETMLFDNGDECNLIPFLWCKLWRREILIEAQNMADDRIVFAEDVAVTYPAVLLAQKVVITDYVGYHYVQHRSSISHNRSNNEYECLDLLYHHLSSVFKHHIMHEHLLDELRGYMKSACLQRCIEMFDKNAPEGVTLLPWGGMNTGKSIIIYGAGRIGQSVYDYIKNSQAVYISAWVDKAYELYEELGMEVESTDVIAKKKFDYIIIAVNRKKLSDMIVNQLVDCGVEATKIRCIDENLKDLFDEEN